MLVGTDGHGEVQDRSYCEQDHTDTDTRHFQPLLRVVHRAITSALSAQTSTGPKRLPRLLPVGGFVPAVRTHAHDDSHVGRRPLAVHLFPMTKESVRMEKSGSREGAEGVIEGLKGRAKETVGAITDDERLKREGEAQQDKARAQRDA